MLLMETNFILLLFNVIYIVLFLMRNISLQSQSIECNLGRNAFIFLDI